MTHIRTLRLLPIFLFASVTLVAGCKDDSRVVQEAVSPFGYSFTHMPIWEKGVKDVTVAVAWGSDWSLSQERNPLVPHIGAEVMQSGGTEALDPTDVLELFDETGSYAKINIMADFIFAETEFPNDHRHEIVPVVGHLLQRPQFDPAWTKRASDSATARAQQESSVLVRMWSMGRRAILGASSQAVYADGDDAELFASIGRSDVLAWHEATFSAAPLAIVVTGAMNTEDAGDVVDEILGAKTVEFSPTATVVSEQYPASTIYLHIPDAEKTTIGFAGPLPATTDGEDILDQLAIRLFSGGAGTPLFEAIRTDLGASYGLNMGIENFSRAQRVVYITGEVEGAKLAAVKEATLAAYSQFWTAPDMNALEGLKTRFAASVRKLQKHVNSSARMLRELKLDGLDLDVYDTLVNRTETISTKDVAARIKKAFPKPEELFVIAAGPNPEMLPGACVVHTLDDVMACLE